jgi:hypothetical protein
MRTPPPNGAPPLSWTLATSSELLWCDWRCECSCDARARRLQYRLAESLQSSHFRTKCSQVALSGSL